MRKEVVEKRKNHR